MHNVIDSSANIDPRVTLGSYNRIGKNVQIRITDPNSDVKVFIGDNNIINDNTRIIIGKAPVQIGDWNVFHNDMLLMGGDGLTIGHNCWFGQNTILDGSGKLIIGNGVRVGMYSQVWTHVASGELIEGCLLYGFRETIIEDDVWLVGSCMVSSGITLGRRSIALSQSNITKSMKPNTVYAGSPAVEKPSLSFYKEKTIEEKMAMMLEWANEFVLVNPSEYLVKKSPLGTIHISSIKTDDQISITVDKEKGITDTSIFNVSDKTFTKRNTKLERDFYRFIYGNKARFIPV